MLQEIITDAGAKHLESDHWQIVYGKIEGEFRGEGVAHRCEHKHQQTTVVPGAILTTLCVTARARLRVLSGHIPHHATIPQTEDMLHRWGELLGGGKVVLGMDANETFKPPLHCTEGGYACTGRGETVLGWMASHDLRMPPQQLHIPTYHPYNTLHQPRRLDYLAVRGITAGAGQVLRCRDMASSDHDGVALPLSIHKGGGASRSSWGPRRLRPEPQVQALLQVPPPQGEDPHATITTLAKAITLPGGGQQKFRESKQLVQMRQQAHQATPGGAARQAWKAVSKQRKQEHRAWQKQLAEQAANLNWRALRALQQVRSHRGWHLPLTDDPNWRHNLSKHMTGIFAKATPMGGPRVEALKRAIRLQCKTTPWRAFTMHELCVTSHGWERNKSTGPDGVSHEAARALLGDVAWGERIREMLSDMLYTHKIPGGIEKGITVLLPKIPSPLEWGDTRPITLSSTFLKWAAQLLLHSAGHQLREGGEGLQWARKGRQGIELVTILRRVVQMSRDWGVPMWIVKLDIRKAFDSVWQHSLAELVAARIPSQRFPVPPGGGGMPWEAGLWLSVLQTRSLNVAVGDVITPIPQTNGSRQGSPDSPDLFGVVIAENLARAIQRTPGQQPDPQGGPPPPKCGGSFLDDTYLWSQSQTHLQSLLTNLEGELQQDGLSIHPTKTAILHSHAEGGGTFTIQGEAVPCQPHGSTIPALGSPITFGDQTAAIIGEMSRRARAAFGKHKQVLRARSSLKPRLLAHTALVRNSALYGAESWPAHQQLLRAANSLQALHIREMLHLRRRPGENWQEWHTRSLRLARVHLHREKGERWSTHILSRIWRLWGHLARGGEEVTAMLKWKNLHFWRGEQQKPARQRVRHAGRFNPGGDIERALESIAGTEWAAVAQDRQKWQQLQQTFVDRFDVPWASGRQQSLHDNLHPNFQRTTPPPHPPLPP